MSEPTTTQVEHHLPRNFLRPCLLLLLREQRGHGYDLLERLQTLGFRGTDPGGLYRALRALEREGMLESGWEKSENGPDRRIYQITRAGMEELHRGAIALAATRDALDTFLSRYGEFVALRGSRQRPALRTGARTGTRLGEP